MAFYQLRKEQIVNANIDEIWDFISAPENLQKITPAYMKFQITRKGLTDKMHPGMIVTYKVSPIPKIRTTWVTEITQVEDKKFFVDEQRMGPYKMWHHQHHLIPVENGVKMVDIVSYIPPFGFLGAIANRLFIAEQLERIFAHRKKVMEEIYPNKK